MRDMTTYIIRPVSILPNRLSSSCHADLRVLHCKELGDIHLTGCFGQLCYLTFNHSLASSRCLARLISQRVSLTMHQLPGMDVMWEYEFETWTVVFFSK
ncbi:uncharacterized protein ARMOST_16068 [Armillaria ostoyae]|uniref:Uncharacterized protein n=1 Tax=Armillaria ostoyae TaxID=47428 RepID=A0A284RV50_ARMOS|nr:uncharacterized protein ARMOST_16068 [Armillaria ostoyae]